MYNMEILHPEKYILSMLSSLLLKNESAETHRYQLRLQEWCQQEKGQQTATDKKKKERNMA